MDAEQSDGAVQQTEGFINMSIFNTILFNVTLWNTGYVITGTIPNEQAIYYNNTSITLDWPDVSGANLYQVQASMRHDFLAPFEDTTTGAGTKYSFTDAQTNNAKRYWRWRYSDDAGTTWKVWSEIGSYWVDTGGAKNIVVERQQWAMFDPDDVNDRYTLDLYPRENITPAHFYRFTGRNRQGDLLSEFLTMKSEIQLNFRRPQYIDHQQFRELRRFNEEIKTFFLATFKDGDRDVPMPNIWKVQYSEDPNLTILAAGRQDLREGPILLTEV